MTTSHTIGWGVIGAGGIARRRMIPEGIAPAGNARLAALTDVDEEAAREVAAEFGGRVCASVDEVVNDKEVQAVYVATPNHLHPEHVLAAVAAGKHVLCEKPLAPDTDAIRAMLDAARGAGVLLGVNFMMRFNVYHRRIRDWIRDGRLGVPSHARGQMTSWHPPRTAAWRHRAAQSGGGVLTDVGGHIVDTMEMLFGRTTEVFCRCLTRVHDSPVEDTALMQLAFESGVAAMADMSFGIPSQANEYVLEVYGSQGAVKCEYTLSQLPGGNVRACLLDDLGGFEAQEKARYQKGYAPLHLEPENNFRTHIEAFSRAVLEGTSAPVPAEDGLWNHRVLQAAYQSAASDRAVRPADLE